MNPTPLRRLLTLASTILFAPCLAHAYDFEKLIMPGEVSAAHANIEADCGKCHSAFDATSESELCSVCHDLVARDVVSEMGFHGRHALARQADCRSCHSEHRGREADLVSFDRVGFDHTLTDFAIGGAHRSVACAKCHAPDALHREADSRCAACHEDVHEGGMGEDCGACHSDANFRGAKFDHAQTSFALRGAHAEVACGLCHLGRAGDAVSSRCSDCHRMDDAHEGRFGPECGKCHSEIAWSRATGFEHDTATSFPLAGRHRTAACESCHRGDEPLPKAPSCVSCHAGEDAHRTLLGDDCGKCHASTTWRRSRFDHDRDTQFSLAGRHAEIDCSGCHVRPPEQASPSQSCRACHTKDDVHAGTLGGDCGGCHDVKGFDGVIRFDHEITRFPLLGMHASAACEACHTSFRFSDASLSCSACHAQDDPHAASLGDGCELCHNPNDWRIWSFDHTQQTSFPLEGHHVGLSCSACHQRSAGGRPAAARECVACHRREDVHRGAFGSSCDYCHGASDWRDAKIAR